MECKGARPTKALRGLGPGLGRERLRREGEGPLGKQIEGAEGRAARIEERLNVEMDAIVGMSCFSCAHSLYSALVGRLAATFIWIIPYCPLHFQLFSFLGTLLCFITFCSPHSEPPGSA